LISKGINYLKEHNKTVNINCVIASHNRNYLDKFFEHLNSLKVGNVVFEFASIPEDHANNIKIFPIPDDDKVNVIKEAQILATKYNINISGEWKFAVSNYFNKQESPYFCNAGIRALVISPDGDVYACQRFVGRKNHRLTKVKTGFIDEINIKSNDVYKGIVMRSPFVNIKSLNSKLDSGGCVKGESSGKSSEKFYQQLFNYYESLPPDKSVFNALDKKVHGMYFNPNIG
jgi:MoaA/NifB/PqqE/SkfB family radical SAM enzyme